MHHFSLNQIIPAGSPLYDEIHRIADENAPKIAELGSGHRNQSTIRARFADFTQSEIDETLHVNLPF